jgi:hypothetical protein
MPACMLLLVDICNLRENCRFWIFLVCQTGRSFNIRYKEHTKAIRSDTYWTQHILEHRHAYRTVEDTLGILKPAKKVPYMNTLGRYYMYKISELRIQINNTYEELTDPIFKTLYKYKHSPHSVNRFPPPIHILTPKPPVHPWHTSTDSCFVVHTVAVQFSISRWECIRSPSSPCKTTNSSSVNVGSFYVHYRKWNYPNKNNNLTVSTSLCCVWMVCLPGPRGHWSQWEPWNKGYLWNGQCCTFKEHSKSTTSPWTTVLSNNDILASLL